MEFPLLCIRIGKKYNEKKMGYQYSAGGKQNTGIS